MLDSARVRIMLTLVSMSGASTPPDKLQALRDGVAAAATPAERVKATMDLARELSFSDPAAARPLLEQLVAEADVAGETKVWAKATNILSELLLRAGDIDGGARHAELLLRSAEATGDRETRAQALHLIGLVHRLRGEFRRALDSFEESRGVRSSDFACLCLRRAGGLGEDLGVL
jgi:hypothetical protein